MVGIWGMGGIGKTTLARVVFRMVSKKFEIRLQQQLILQILNENMSVQDVNDGVFVIKNKLYQLDQLNKLAGSHFWFGLGSRVIITTRDKHLLQTLGVDEIYESNGLTHDESFCLLSLKAFKKDHPPKDYLKLSKYFVYYANGLPLAIEILGSFLFGRNIDQWKSTLNRLKQFPKNDIFQVLRISFDGLHETEKEIFLNIACFFNHKEKNDVVEILDYLDLFPDVGLGVLFDKSLVKYCGHTLWMHDLLQEMGKNIVYKECPKELGKRGKLWLFKDINDVLTKNTSFDSLKFIQLKKSLKLIETLNFNKIPNLEKLVLEDCINLRSLHPSIGVCKQLSILNLKGCKNLRSLPIKFEMESLEILILSGCSNLKRNPEFGENMESVSRLYLDGTAITKLPTSIRNLTSLASLNVKDCRNLISLPSTVFNMKWLKNLNLSRCSKLLENLVTEKSVEEVDVSGTATGLMPYYNALFQTLKKLSFGQFKQRSLNCMGLLSTSLSGLCSLTRLDLSYCNLNAIPNDICYLFSLKYLFLSGNNFSCLPESIAQLSIPKSLEVDNCTSLRSWPKLPLNIFYISGYGCTLLEMLPDLFQTNSLSGRGLFHSNCSKVAENQGFIDMFFATIIKSLRLPLSRSWMGIAVCVVFCSHSHNQILKDCSLSCRLIANGKEMCVAPNTGEIVPLSDHIWLIYLLPQFYGKKDIKALWECNANGFSQIRIKIETQSQGFRKELTPIMVKKCGLRMVCMKDIKDLNRTLVERSNKNITLYEGLDVPHHNFDNSMAVAAECYKANRTRDDCDGVGSSNYEPHPKRIERLTEFMAQEAEEIICLKTGKLLLPNVLVYCSISFCFLPFQFFINHRNFTK
ncbi:hypothetical protein ACB092_11G028500 [Castanea dentata]